MEAQFALQKIGYPLMASVIRKVFAAISAFGIAVGIVAYAQSLSGTTVGDRSLWVILLGVGVVAIQIPMFILERPSVGNRTFFWKGFARGMPTWVVPFVKLCWVAALAHLIWFFIISHRAVPVIKDGQFILSSRGRIIRVLTEKEYLILKADELRVFAALMIACYLVPLGYWWFPRDRPEPK